MNGSTAGWTLGRAPVCWSIAVNKTRPGFSGTIGQGAAGCVGRGLSAHLQDLTLLVPASTPAPPLPYPDQPPLLYHHPPTTQTPTPTCAIPAPVAHGVVDLWTGRARR